MTLILGNDLTALVSREVDASGRKSSGLGISLTTGNDVFVEVVDAFLGNSLRDREILLGAIAKNTAYGVNLLTVTNEYLKTIASLLQDSLKIISSASAGSLSADKLAVLQKNLNDKKAQVNLLINTASFDGKKLLKGDVSNIEAQIGLNITDKLKMKVNDISNEKLFRSSITTELNEKIKSGNFPTRYYINIDEINAAANRNINLFCASALALPAIRGGGSGPVISTGHMANLLFDLSPTQKVFLDQIALVAKNFLTTANPGVTFINASAVQIEAMLRINNIAATEIYNITKSNAICNISSVVDTTALIRTQDIFQNALNLIRAEQVSVLNQKNNIIEVEGSLRAVTNVTQQAANSYLKTDYVLTAQQYSEEIRMIVTSITALQAANKIPEAAQRLIDSLAR